ncbi:MAG: hypothetical protein ACREVI_13030 [Steroidobacteraceae bacterium]
MRNSGGLDTSEMLPSAGRIHIVGAGPVGLLLTALLQTMGTSQEKPDRSSVSGDVGASA